MFTTLKNAFKIKDIRNKIFFTALMLVVVRLGSAIPVPGINSTVFQNWFSNLTSSSDALGFLDRFTGGSFETMSILALNITPYITSSIIIQLLTVAIPKFEEWQHDGEDGRKKLTALTRYITIALALIESIAMSIGFYRQNFLVNKKWYYCVVIVVALTAGSAFLMWLGERITDNGVGNGISIILTINIISRMPSDISTLFSQFVLGHSIVRAVIDAMIIIAIIIGMVVLVVLLNDAERHIPVQYTRKLQGRKMAGSSNSEIPLKVNTAGVMPIIFAMSLFQFPIIISQFVGYNGTGAWSEILKYLNESNWIDPEHMIYSLGLVVYVILLVLFAYFYTSLTFNPLEIADNMKKQGGFIPGIRPGKPTSDYLSTLLKYIIFIGACGLTIIAILPIFFNGVFNANVSFGGTSLIIIVSVILETIKQIESQMLVRNYKGFLDD